MKRSKRNRYIEYDYEAAYNEQIEKLEEDQIKRYLKNGGSVYATKEIYAGDQLEVEIYPEFTREQKDEIPSEALKRRTREAKRNLNEKNSRKECERKVNANFGDHDIWATLTYDDDHLPETFEQAQRDIRNYIRRLNDKRKKLGLNNTAFVRVIEGDADNPETDRLHHHIILSGDISLELVEDTWNGGGRNTVRRCVSDEAGLTGLAKYITKENKKKGQKKWTCSKGLKDPEIHKNHYKFKKRTIEQMIRDRDQIKPELLKRYGDKYEFNNGDVRYNKFNGKFYISARLHLKPELKQAKPKRNNTKRMTHKDKAVIKKPKGDPMSEKQKECIREKLVNLRHDAGLTQSEVAAEIGVSRQVYNRYERGLQYIPMSRLEIIADFYGVTTEYLLDE